MILHQLPLRSIYDTLPVANSTLLTADTILWFTNKKLFPIVIITYSCSAPFVPPNLLFVQVWPLTTF